MPNFALQSYRRLRRKVKGLTGPEFDHEEAHHLALRGVGRTTYGTVRRSVWLKAGIRPTEVVRRLGHSVAVLPRVHPNCVHGGQDPVNERIVLALSPGAGRGTLAPAPGSPGGAPGAGLWITRGPARCAKRRLTAKPQVGGLA